MKGDFQLGHAAFYPHVEKLFPNASKSFLKLHGLSGSSNCAAAGTVLERPPRPRPLAAPQVEVPDSSRVLVRVVSYRRRLLDEDNLAEKYFVDCARYAGLLSGDEPSKTKIEVSQIKVKAKEDERTEITITYP